MVSVANAVSLVVITAHSPLGGLGRGIRLEWVDCRVLLPYEGSWFEVIFPKCDVGHVYVLVSCGCDEWVLIGLCFD